MTKPETSTPPMVVGLDRKISRQRCEYCDDTGDAHDQTGEWRGQCKCGAAEDTEERYLRETLAMLRESYERQAQPYIDRMTKIYAMRPPPPMIVTLEQAQALGLVTANVKVSGCATEQLPNGDNRNE